jgi:LCP family protein required for cell wall assembly
MAGFFLRKILTVIAFLGIFLIGFFIALEGFKISKIFDKNPFRGVLPTPNTFSLATAKPIEQVTPEKQDKGTYNVLFLGYGGGGHSGGGLMDSIIVAHIDLNTKKVTFITVPRDLWVPGNHKINTSALAGFDKMGPIVTSVTGLPINYYAAVDFKGFSKIIDALGGITSNTPAAFTDPYYPIPGEENNLCGKSLEEVEALKAKYSGYNLEIQFTCRYEKVSYPQGPVELNGTNALKYVRSRHGDSDFGRSARQMSILEGIAAKLITIKSAGKFDEIVNIVSGMVKTDLDAGTIKSLIQIMGNPEEYKFARIQLTTENFLQSSTSSDRQFILVPKAGSSNFEVIKTHIKSQI